MGAAPRLAGVPDAVVQPASFALLSQLAPDAVTLLPPPGTLLFSSGWPVVSLVNSHVPHAPSFDAVAAGVQARQGETALVWRLGLRPCLAFCTAAEAALVQALLAGQTMLAALDAALAVEPLFDFSAWLNSAVAQGQVLGAVRLATPD